MDYIYDIETYPNCFSFVALAADKSEFVQFECSQRKNQAADLFSFLDKLREHGHRMVGFNNIGFDYPVVHDLLSVREKAVTVSGKAVAVRAYKKAKELINSDEKFEHIIRTADEHVPQIDLYKIHHFDNKARATSLKMLQFNMRSDTIEDLPFEVGTQLSDEQIDTLLSYNKHDVIRTLDFYNESKSALKFREELTQKYGRNFLNHNDTKIGKDYFIMRLEEELPGSCYSYDNKGRRSINQTKRKSINVKECLFDYYDFHRPEFQAVFDWFAKQKISETKGVFSEIDESDLGDVAQYAQLYTKRKKFPRVPSFEDIDDFKQQHPLGWVEKVELKAKKKGEVQHSHWMCWKEADNLNVIVDDFRFDFGTGGIHGSLENTIVEADDDNIIVDADVSSMYPNIAIANRVYPKHLSEKFCDIYEDVYNQRKSYAKGTAENAMLKLALNGVYGDSNNQYSPFYDPQYTMSITINGQLSLCYLAEQLLKIRGMQIIQVNTDGITVKFPKKYRRWYDTACKQWQENVGLELEFAEYSKMFIRDVNNYIAVYTNGKTKRKGAYQYEGLGWHQDQGGLIIPKAAEAHMLDGTDIECYIRANAHRTHDFMMRTKVPRSSRLVLVQEDGSEVQQQNICRYYASINGGKLIKIMPALTPDGDARRIGIDTDYLLKTCNNMEDFSNDIDYSYYVDAAKKLLINNTENEGVDQTEVTYL
jgi:hypothetical protein